MTTTAVTTRPEFDVEVSTHSPGYNKVQQVASYMCVPAFAMGLMGIAGGLALGVVDGVHIHDHTYSAANIETLHQVAQGALIGGMAFVLAGLSFSIALILGTFRKGGGDVQEATRRSVQVLKRPLTAWVLLGMMMMGMMIDLAAAVLHVIWGLQVHGTAASLALSAERFTALVGAERLGIGMYLTGIAFGLAAIIHVLRYQAKHIREIPAEPARS